MDMRAATLFSGGHSDDVDYLSWNPTHPDLFCTSSQKDRRIIFWDARRMPCCFWRLCNVLIIFSIHRFFRKPPHPAMFSEGFASANELCSRRAVTVIRVRWSSALFHNLEQ